MSATVQRAAALAVERATDRLERLAGEELPGDIAVERVDGGLRLTGPRLAPRWAADARLRGLAATAARSGT